MTMGRNNALQSAALHDGIGAPGRPSLNTRVLVIDDDEMVREVICEILAEQSSAADRLSQANDELFGLPLKGLMKPPKALAELGFEVFTCASGKDGFEVLKKQNDLGLPFATVLVDMKMPGWNGIETVRKIREIDGSVAVNFVSAFSDFNLQTMCEVGGADVGYFCKPFSADEIKQAVTRSVYAWNQMRALEDLMTCVAGVAATATNFGGFLESFNSSLLSLHGQMDFAIVQRKGKSEFELLSDSLGLKESGDYEKVRALILAAEPPAATGDGFHFFSSHDSFLIMPRSAVAGITAARCLSSRSVQKFFESCLRVMQGVL